MTDDRGGAVVTGARGVAERGQQRDGRALVRVIWANVGMLAAANVALCAALVPAFACEVAGIWFLEPVLAMLAVTVLAAGTSANAAALLDGDHVGWRDWLARAREAAPSGARPGLVAGVLLTAAQASLMAYHASHAAWLLVPLVLDGACLMLFSASLGYLLVLGHRYALRGRRLWYAGLWCAARAPATTIALLITLGLVLVLLVLLGPGLLLVLPAPVVVGVTAMARPVTTALADAAPS